MKADWIAMMRDHVGTDLSGHLSGLSRWLNGRIHSISEDGQVVMRFEVRPDMINPLGFLHGGSVAAILDEVMGLQLFLHSADQVFVSSTLYVDFLSKSVEGEQVLAHPRVVRVGKTTANVECHLYNIEGKLLAKGVCNYARIN